MIIPTLLRGYASTDAPRSALEGTRSVPGCIPTQSVGTIKFCELFRSLWERACSRRRWVSHSRCRLKYRIREQARSHICYAFPSPCLAVRSPRQAARIRSNRSACAPNLSAISDAYRSSETHRYLSGLTGAQNHQHRFNHSITRPECTAMFAICPAPASPSGFHYSVGLERGYTTPQRFCRGLA